jgi:DNA topoisomerase-1
MSKTLVVVESPAKARKIQKFLGPKYVVKASLGHIYDLPAKKLGVDLKTFAMEHVPMSGKKKVISELKKAFTTCKKQVILAPDPDREGEAIAYHVAKCLGVDPF